jgi:signal transduction histidine kinase
LNIRERARLVGGTVEIRSSPGQGTSVTVEAPG